MLWTMASTKTVSRGHSCVLQACVLLGLSTTGHACPPYAALWVTVRVRWRSPPPQSMEQTPHDDHDESTQSTGQCSMLHCICEIEAGQAAPLWAAATTMLRERLADPPPQLLVQLDHALHSDMAQSIAQVAIPVQSRVSLWSRQGAPPYCAVWSTVLYRSCGGNEDPSGRHAAGHCVQSDQGLRTQSMGHACTLQLSVSTIGGHATPPCALGIDTLRSRTCCPPPHTAPHVDQSVQSDTSQLTGQGFSPHESLCVKGGHTAPPFCGAVTTLRSCIVKPPPHVALHSVGLPHADTTQSTAHGPLPHASASFRSGHTAPPNAEACVTVRVRVRCPPPHTALQSPHWPHALTEQSTGHSCALHVALSCDAEHAVPLHAAATSVGRVRDVVPPPHVIEHWLHWLQLPIMQCTAQHSVAQVEVPTSAAQTAPPQRCGAITERYLLRVPPPHALLHGSQDPQLDTSQSASILPSTGHGGQVSVLHGRSSFIAPHATPPSEGTTTTARLRTCLPPPQYTVQAPQSDQLVSAQSTGHGWTLHDCDAASAGHAAPPQATAVSTVRVRDWLPEPHEASQELHSCQLDTVHATGQHSVPQARSDVSSGHAVPLCAAGCSTVRSRCCVPPPHCAPQTCQLLHSDTTHGTGQLCSLQAITLDRAGQIVPPCCGSTSMVRLRCALPPPHVLSQLPNADH